MSESGLSGKTIREKLRGESLGSVFNSDLRQTLDAGSAKTGKEKLADRLAGKSAGQRKAVYEELGIDSRGAQRIEKTISGKRAPTRMEMKRMEKKEEARKRRNIFMSRRSDGESRGVSSPGGATGYEESTGEFAGGRVKTRTRVSMIGRKAEKNQSGTALGNVKKKGFALGDPKQKKGGFARSKGTSNMNKGGFAGKAGNKSAPGGASTPGLGGGRRGGL